MSGAVHRFISWAGSLRGGRILLGAIFFAIALTPTLVPRDDLAQGLLAGGCFAIGYGIAALFHWLWRYLELPELSLSVRRMVNAVLVAAGVLTAATALLLASHWQNATRAAMDMGPAEPSWSLVLGATALAVIAIVLLVAQLFRASIMLVAPRVQRVVPRRVANVVALLLAAFVFWSITNTVIVRGVFRVMDASYQEWDRLFEPERPQPADPNKTGGANSLVRWDELGRTGRRYVASGPSADEIAALSGRPALTPIRVYVGLQSGVSTEARAKLALSELKRQGGFERANLIVVTPTGTGWIDPSAIDAVEYLQGGDIASVAIQYSYLSSPLSLLAQSELGAEAARALFREIYGYWTTLPKAQRPKLYLHGLSLGAMNSELSVEPFDLLADPIAGALWSGPPFPSRMWRSITNDRNAGSPAWLPTFRDGRFARFMNQRGSVVPADTPWGPMRVVYLQYASDAITFFDYQTAYRRPAWMLEPRGPDVSESLRWFPIVTMLQLAIDMILANKTPMGFGHVYAPEHYLEAWLAVTGADKWTPDAIARLKQHLGERGRAPPPGADNPYEGRGG